MIRSVPLRPLLAHLALLVLVLVVCLAFPVGCALAAGDETSPVIFADTVGSGWQSKMYSWNCSATYDATLAAVGRYAIKAQLSAYGGLAVGTTSPLKADDYAALSFRIRGAVGGEKLRVGLYDGATELPGFGGLHLTKPLVERVTTDYQRVVIPLASFRAAGHRLSKVSFMADTRDTQTIYVDQVELLRSLPASTGGE